MKLLRAQWDRCAAIAAVVVGLVSLLLGWIGVSGTAYVAEQMSFVASGGLFGVFSLGIGAALWLSADLRDEWRKLDSVEQVLVAALDRLPISDEVAIPHPPRPLVDEGEQGALAEAMRPRRTARRVAKAAAGQ
jgi:hypothetical protein